MNGRIVPQLVIVFILAVGVSLGAMVLVLNSRDVTGNTTDMGDLGSKVAKVEADLDEARLEINDLSADLLKYQNRFDSLERKNSDLAKRNTNVPASTGAELSKADVEKLASLSSDEKALYRAVDNVMKEREAEEERQRRAAREVRRQEQAERTQKWLNETYVEHLKKLVKELDLTGAQEVDIKAALDIRREGISKMYTQRNQDGDTGERVSWEEINKNYQEEVENILTQEQMKIYKEKKLENAFNRGGRGRSWGGGGRRGSGR